jgi:DNA polymerase III alpha subunit
MPDIDIDFLDRTQVLGVIKHVPAAIKEDGSTFKKHNTGVYCHSITHNPITGLASLDYKEAEARGYFKLDFLNVSAYRGVRDETHLKDLLSTEPLWDLLYEKEICDQLFHINGYHNLFRKLKPGNVLEIAMFLALLRPAKKHLIPVCEAQGWSAIEQEIWAKSTDGSYGFKKSHAVAYAHVIVVQLNLICEQISIGYS